jgi:hypothetical protein
MDINSDVGFCDGGSFRPVEELFDKFTEVTTSPSPAGACLRVAASAKAGERVRVRVDTRTIPLTFILSPKRRGD